MSVYLSPLQGLTQTVNELEARLGVLRANMLAQTHRWHVAAAFEIPFRGQVTVDNDDVIVTELFGAEAYAHVANAITTVRIEPLVQNNRETLRAPAVAALPLDWLAELHALNALKAEIEQLSGQIEPQHKRTEAWASFHGLSALQTMRRNWIVDGPHKIRFYWDSAPSVQNKTARAWIKQLRTLLLKHYGYVPSVQELSPEDGMFKYAYGLSRLEREIDPDEHIAAFRKGQPHVRARVTFIDSLPAVIRPAPTPILYPIGDPEPSISALSNWVDEDTNKPRSIRTKIEAEPFIEALYFHRYLPQHRMG